MERLNTPRSNSLGEAAFCISRKNNGLTNDRQPYKLGIIFFCVSVLAFLLGSAASKTFGAENVPGFTKIVSDYLSYEVKCENASDVLSAFVKLSSFDVQCLLVIFAFAFFLFPSLASCGVLIYRGAALGITVGTAFSTESLSSGSTLGILLFTAPQLFSFVSLILCGFAACSFNEELRKFSFKFPATLRSGGFKRYVFSFLVSLGISAVSAGIRTLCYCIN